MVLHCRHHSIDLLRDPGWGHLTIIRSLDSTSFPPIVILYPIEHRPDSGEHLLSVLTYTVKNLIISLWFGEHLSKPTE